MIFRCLLTAGYLIRAMGAEPSSASKLAQMYYQSQTLSQLLGAKSDLDPETLQFLRTKAKPVAAAHLPKMVLDGQQMTWPDWHLTLDLTAAGKGEFLVNQHAVLCTPVTADAVCYDRVTEALKPKSARLSWISQAHAGGEIAVVGGIAAAIIAVWAIKSAAQADQVKGARPCDEQVQALKAMLSRGGMTLQSGCAPGMHRLHVTINGEKHDLDPIEKGVRDVTYYPDLTDRVVEVTDKNGHLMLQERQRHEIRSTAITDPKVAEQRQKEEAAAYDIATYIGQNFSCVKCKQQILKELKGLAPTVQKAGVGASTAP